MAKITVEYLGTASSTAEITIPETTDHSHALSVPVDGETTWLDVRDCLKFDARLTDDFPDNLTDDALGAAIDGHFVGRDLIAPYDPALAVIQPNSNEYVALAWFLVEWAE